MKCLVVALVISHVAECFGLKKHKKFRVLQYEYVIVAASLYERKINLIKWII